MTKLQNKFLCNINIYCNYISYYYNKYYYYIYKYSIIINNIIIFTISFISVPHMDPDPGGSVFSRIRIRDPDPEFSRIWIRENKRIRLTFIDFSQSFLCFLVKTEGTFTKIVENNKKLSFGLKNKAIFIVIRIFLDPIRIF